MNSLAKTVTRQSRDCDLNPGLSAPESSTLTTRLPRHPSHRKVWVCLNMTPKSALSCGRGRSGPPPNTRFLGPHEYATPTAFRSVQPFTLITTHTRGQRTDRPRYNGNNRPPLMLYTHSDAGQQLIFTDIAHVSKTISKCSLYKRARRSEKV